MKARRILWHLADSICTFRRSRFVPVPGSFPVGLTALLASAMIGLGIPAANGQVKYTPEHETVQRMCEKAAKFLEANIPLHRGELVLAAITVVEVSKRYHETVPVDNPIVVKAINEIRIEVADLIKNLEMNDPNIQPDIRKDGMYKLCLNIIFLCDINYDKYRNEIGHMVNYMLSQQLPSGGYGYSRPGNGDTSQSQYIGLALAVLKLHGHEVDPERARILLDWFCKTQLSQGNAKGTWAYHYQDLTPFNPLPKRSLHVAGAGTVYLLADFLNLTPSGVQGAKKRIQGINWDLPPSVREHITDEKKRDPKSVPLATFDRGLLARVKNEANQWLGANFSIENTDHEWTYYYMYGLERYAYFREKSEGEMPEFPTWYDIGVDYLEPIQSPSGYWEPTKTSGETKNNATCLATLFLVRSSQLLLKDSRMGPVVANREAFQENKRIRQGTEGNLIVEQDTQNMVDLLSALKEDNSKEKLAGMVYEMAGPLKEFTDRDKKSKAETVGFLRGLVTDFEPYRRLVAVKFLASLQDLDNVPALLYALGDPEMEIAVEAHNGLRLISRKLDSFPISDKPSELEMQELKKKWTEWYLGIKPGANLLD